MSKTSSPDRPRDSADSPGRNCNGSTPIPTRLERWMRSKLSASTARTPSNVVPFAAQSRDDPEPYSLPASTTSGVPCFGVTHGCVVDRGHVAGREERGEAPLGPGRQLVAEPDVGEGASHHDLVVASARPVRVEIGRRHTVLYQPRTCRAVFPDVPGGRDVVGRDGPAELGERPGAVYVAKRRRLVAASRRRTAVGGRKSKWSPTRSARPSAHRALPSARRRAKTSA